METNGVLFAAGERERRGARSDPEVSAKADAWDTPGEVGELLRREGLYSSHLWSWRKAAGEGSLRGALTKRVVERALEGELTDHLGYEKHAREGHNSGNSRNGRTRKRVKTDTSEFEIEVPRDRDSTFDPEFVRKGQRRLFVLRVLVRFRYTELNEPGKGLVKGFLGKVTGLSRAQLTRLVG